MQNIVLLSRSLNKPLIDRLLYAVDEWLRFRGGQGRVTLVAKTVLGFVWFLVSYLVRLYVNVFIEPSAAHTGANSDNARATSRSSTISRPSAMIDNNCSAG